MEFTSLKSLEFLIGIFSMRLKLQRNSVVEQFYVLLVNVNMSYTKPSCQCFYICYVMCGFMTMTLRLFCCFHSYLIA